MPNRCANCTAVIKPGTGRQFGTAWLDDDCLGTLAERGYLVGTDKTGSPSKLTPTTLIFQRDGHLVTYLANANYWKEFYHYRYSSQHVRAWLESLPDSVLQPFGEKT